MVCVVSGVIIRREIIKNIFSSSKYDISFFFIIIDVFFSSSSYKHRVINQTLSLVSQKDYSIGGSVKSKEKPIIVFFCYNKNTSARSMEWGKGFN